MKKFMLMMIDFGNFAPKVIDTFEAFRVKTDSQKNIIAYGSNDIFDVKFILPHIPNTYIKEVPEAATTEPSLSDTSELLLKRFSCQVKDKNNDIYRTVGGQSNLTLKDAVEQALMFCSHTAYKEGWYKEYVRVYDFHNLTVVFEQTPQTKWAEYSVYPEIKEIEHRFKEENK